MNAALNAPDAFIGNVEVKKDCPGRPIFLTVAPDAKSYLARVGCATRGEKPTAMVTALVNSRNQLSFAKALLAHDAKGIGHSLRGGGMIVDATTLKKA